MDLVSPSSPSERSGARFIGGWLALLIAVFLAYLPAMRAGFIWDDDDYVTQNQTLRTADGLRQIWLDPRATP